VVSFDAVCHRAVETDRGQIVNVTRAGDTTGPASVPYSTADARRRLVRTTWPAAGVLEFAAGETTKSISLGTDRRLRSTKETGRSLSSSTTPLARSVVAARRRRAVKIVDDERARRVGSWGEAIPSQVVPINMTLAANRQHPVLG